MARRILFLSMPIEALLEVLTGRATAKLPSNIPTDSTLLYSYIDPESQTLKIAVTHPTFEIVKQSGYVKSYLIESVPVPTEKEKEAKGYSGESLLTSEDWSRLV